MIHLGNLAVVQGPAETGAVGLGRLVGSVGVVEVDPGEEWLLARLVEPGEGAVDHHAPGALGLEAGVRVERDFVVEAREPVGEAEAVVEHEGADEGTGAVPGRGQSRRQRPRRRGKALRPVVAYAVARRQQTREDRGVGRRREGHRRGDVGQPHARGGESVQRRCLGAVVPVDSDVVGAHRVDGDEEEVEAFAGSRRVNPRAAGQEREHARKKHETDPQRPRTLNFLPSGQEHRPSPSARSVTTDGARFSVEDYQFRGVAQSIAPESFRRSRGVASLSRRVGR